MSKRHTQTLESTAGRVQFEKIIFSLGDGREKMGNSTLNHCMCVGIKWKRHESTKSEKVNQSARRSHMYKAALGQKIIGDERKNYRVNVKP